MSIHISCFDFLTFRLFDVSNRRLDFSTFKARSPARSHSGGGIGLADGQGSHAPSIGLMPPPLLLNFLPLSYYQPNATAWRIDRSCIHLLDGRMKRRVMMSQNKDDQIKCRKCGSSQLTANKKGCGLGKAAVGGLLLGPLGLFGGVLGSGKVKITCLKCGHQWKAGQR